MRIVFDQGVPKPLRAHLRGHFIRTSRELGWPRLTNGRLLAAAEEAGFDLLITTDKNMSYQQNLTGRRIAVGVLSQQQWPGLRPHVSLIVDALDSVAPAASP